MYLSSKSLLFEHHYAYNLTDMQLLWFVRLSEPQLRPTFLELVDNLKDLLRQCAIQAQAAGNVLGDSSQKEL